MRKLLLLLAVMFTFNGCGQEVKDDQQPARPGFYSGQEIYVSYLTDSTWIPLENQEWLDTVCANLGHVPGVPMLGYEDVDSVMILEYPAINVLQENDSQTFWVRYNFNQVLDTCRRCNRPIWWRIYPEPDTFFIKRKEGWTLDFMF